jgi:hypothetical protein
MTETRIITIVDFEVESCPRCGKSHPVKLKGYLKESAGQKIPLFGGPGTKKERLPEMLLICPETQKKFTHQIPQEDGVEIVGLASETDLTLAAAARSANPTVKSDLDEWAKKSRDVAIDFCKTMLSASTGGIPLYFAVLKYLGFEKISDIAVSRFAVVPPMLFLSAAILYVLALRPRHELVTPLEFDAFRAKRLAQLNRMIIWATTSFLGAVCFAIVILFYIISQ